VCNEKENQKFNRHTTLIHGSDLLSSKQVQIYGNRHDITEILLKVAVNTIKQTLMLVSEEKKNIDNTVYSSTTCGSICLKSSVLTNNSLVYGVVSWNLDQGEVYKQYAKWEQETRKPKSYILTYT
jgi:hypothetical protein